MFLLTLPLFFVAVEMVTSQYPENGRYSRSRIRHQVPVNNSRESTASRLQDGGSYRPCDTDQLVHRLSTLEAQTSEKSENLRSELRETNQRLQDLKWQSGEVQTTLERFRNELERFRESSSTSSQSRPHQVDKLELRIDNLEKGIQLAIAALRGIHGDFAQLRKNISTIMENSRSLPLQDLVTKQFLTDSLADVKLLQLLSPSPTGNNDVRLQIEEQKPPKNCKEVQERGHTVSGVYHIQPSLAPKPFMVMCELEARGGGWTYIQNRYDGSQDFYLNWHSYKLGFGNLGGEFWLGLEHLHQLTGSAVNELLIELKDADLKQAYAHYAAFSVGDEQEGYALKVLGGYSGDAGDSLIYHAGSEFSTKDMDHDGWPEGSCAQAHGGAWWYKSCDNSNLNGRFLNGNVPEEYTYQGMYWSNFHGPQYSLKQSRMLVRPIAKPIRS